LAAGYKKRSIVRSKVEMDGFYNFSSQWYPCHLHDLSLEGAGLKINQVFYPGDIIRLRFGFRSDQRVVEAKVANVNGTRIGVRFSLDPLTTAFVQSVIEAFQRPTIFRRNL